MTSSIELHLREPHDTNPELEWLIEETGYQLTYALGRNVDHGYGPRWACPVCPQHEYSIAIHPFPLETSVQVLCTQGCNGSMISVMVDLLTLVKRTEGLIQMRSEMSTWGIKWTGFGYSTDPTPDPDCGHGEFSE